MRILLIAEHDNRQLRNESCKTLSAAQQIREKAGGRNNSGIDVLVAGHQCRAVAEQCAGIDGVSRVMLADEPAYEHHLAESLAGLISELAKDYTHVLCSSSTSGKNVMPRVAALLDVAQISNISAVVTEDTFMRPIYAGNALLKIKSHDGIRIITVMASAFDNACGEQDAVEVRELQVKAEANVAQFLSEKINTSKRPPLQSARVVIAGGRGLKSAENYQRLEALADKLDAAIAATRAVVDEGWASNDKQVGQTGKTVAPELYIALGISGAAQHLAGMKDSKLIVAINKDPEAPIFQAADYGLVADLNEVLPKLNALL